MTEPALPVSTPAPHEPEARLRLKSPTDLTETVPYLVGFQPRRSIVVVCVRRRELRLTIRLDLPPSRYLQGSTRQLVRHVVRSGADLVLLACYPEGPADRKIAKRMVSGMRRELRLRSVTVKEAVRVEEDRWWSYLCDNPECCPPEGTPLPSTPGPAAAMAVVAGEVVLADRSALYDRLKPVNDIALIATVQAMADAAPVALGRHAEGDEEAWRDAERTFLDGLLARYEAGAGRVAPAEAGRALVALQDVEVRDAGALWWEDKARCRASVPLWTDLVRHAPPECVAPAATLLAGAAWLSGEGAYANVALERALAGDSSYRLARLLEAAVQGGISPEQWRATTRRLSGTAQDGEAD